MKILLKTGMVSLFCMGILCGRVWALPVLQVNAIDGTWVGGSEESVVTHDRNVTLQIFWEGDGAGHSLAIDDDDDDDAGHSLAIDDDDIYVTFALDKDVSFSEGSLTVNGDNADDSGTEITKHNDTLPFLDKDKMAPHGIYETNYYELEISDLFDTGDIFNVQTGGSHETGLIANLVLNIQGFNFMHFDAYGENANDKSKNTLVNAPFSKDAVFTTAVPEPSSLWLLAIGLFGLIFFRFKRPSAVFTKDSV